MSDKILIIKMYKYGSTEDDFVERKYKMSDKEYEFFNSLIKTSEELVIENKITYLLHGTIIDCTEEIMSTYMRDILKLKYGISRDQVKDFDYRFGPNGLFITCDVEFKK